MEKNVDLPQLYYRALIRRSFSAARYWGAGLSTLERDGEMVWAVLSLEAKKSVRYHGNDDADLINFLSSIEECPVALVFVEGSQGRGKKSRGRGARATGMWPQGSRLGLEAGGHRAAGRSDNRRLFGRISSQGVLRATP